MSSSIWTIGHSTRPIDEFITLLKAHHVHRLVDVRTVPHSRHNPQFNTEQLDQSLRQAGLNYVHMPQLGGLRKAKKDSVNLGWRNASFRGYADYMLSEEFWKAIEELMTHSRSQLTAIMCAEAVPWRCHRALIADALVSRGSEVRHIMSEAKADPHRLTAFATLENGSLLYPDPEASSRLF
jgi:uncharacterized protein (DUF488 family)